MFLISKCREKSDLGLCMSSVLAKRMPLRSADFWFKNVSGRKIRWKSALRSGILFASTKLMRTVVSVAILIDFWYKNLCTKNFSSNFCFVKSNLVVKTNWAHSICSEMRAWRITGKEKQRKNKDNFGTGHVRDLTFELTLRENRHFGDLHCCAGVQPRLLSAMCINLTQRHDKMSSAPSRHAPCKNTISWYKCSICDWFPKN